MVIKLKKMSGTNEKKSKIILVMILNGENTQVAQVRFANLRLQLEKILTLDYVSNFQHQNSMSLPMKMTNCHPDTRAISQRMRSNKRKKK